MTTTNLRRLLPLAAAVAMLVPVIVASGPGATSLVTIGGMPPPVVQAPDDTEPPAESDGAGPAEATPPLVDQAGAAETGAASPATNGGSTSAAAGGRRGATGTESATGGSGPGGDDGEGLGGGGLGGGGLGPGGPTVTTAPPPPPPPPPPSLAFGVNIHPSGIGYDANDTAHAVADLAPGSIVRVSVPWQQLQLGLRAAGGPCGVLDAPFLCPTPGPITWEFLDKELPALQRLGVRVLLLPMSAPPWARAALDLPRPNSDGQIVMPPENSAPELAMWQDFVSQMVAHVEQTYPGMLAGVEVWNEPNGLEFWTTAAPPNPARYVGVLCHAYQGVKAVDPDLPVLFGGTNPQPPFPAATKRSVPDFVGAAYAAGAAGCMDSLALHPYPVGPSERNAPITLDEQIAAFAAQIGSLRDVAAASGDAGRPISITEVNMATEITDEAMAEFLVRTYELADAMPDVDMFIVHTLFDDPNGGDQFERMAGVCAAPGQPQAPAHALKQLLTGSTTPASC